MDKYQVMPALTDEEFAALKESIREKGILEPILVDTEGNIIDGHHRKRAAKELTDEGNEVHVPVERKHGLSDYEKVELAYTLNTTRRQLGKEWKQQEAAKLREQGWPIERIGKVLGVPRSTIGRWLNELSQMGKLSQPETILGADGKERKSSYERKPESEPAPVDCRDCGYWHPDEQWCGLYGERLARDEQVGECIDFDPEAERGDLYPPPVPEPERIWCRGCNKAHTDWRATKTPEGHTLWDCKRCEAKAADDDPDGPVPHDPRQAYLPGTEPEGNAPEPANAQTRQRANGSEATPMGFEPVYCLECLHCDGPDEDNEYFCPINDKYFIDNADARGHCEDFMPNDACSFCGLKPDRSALNDVTGYDKRLACDDCMEENAHWCGKCQGWHSDFSCTCNECTHCQKGALNEREVKADADVATQPEPPAARADDDQHGGTDVGGSGETVSGDVPAPSTHALILSSESNEWYTPTYIIVAAHEVMGGIDIDPASCARANQVVGAKVFFSIDDDGLAQEWYSRVWLNPPYGKRDDGTSNQALWSAKLIEEFEAGRVTEAILLVNATPGNAWFRPLWEYPICFAYERIRFYNADGVSNQPTNSNALVYMGPNIARFAEVFSKVGAVVARLEY